MKPSNPDMLWGSGVLGLRVQWFRVKCLGVYGRLRSREASDSQNRRNQVPTLDDPLLGKTLGNAGAHAMRMCIWGSALLFPITDDTGLSATVPVANLESHTALGLDLASASTENTPASNSDKE